MDRYDSQYNTKWLLREYEDEFENVPRSSLDPPTSFWEPWLSLHVTPKPNHEPASADTKVRDEEDIVETSSSSSTSTQEECMSPTFMSDQRLSFQHEASYADFSSLTIEERMSQWNLVHSNSLKFGSPLGGDSPDIMPQALTTFYPSSSKECGVFVPRPKRREESGDRMHIVDEGGSTFPRKERENSTLGFDVASERDIADQPLCIVVPPQHHQPDDVPVEVSSDFVLPEIFVPSPKATSTKEKPVKPVLKTDKEGPRKDEEKSLGVTFGDFNVTVNLSFSQTLSEPQRAQIVEVALQEKEKIDRRFTDSEPIKSRSFVNIHRPCNDVGASGTASPNVFALVAADEEDMDGDQASFRMRTMSRVASLRRLRNVNNNAPSDRSSGSGGKITLRRVVEDTKIDDMSALMATDQEERVQIALLEILSSERKYFMSLSTALVFRASFQDLSREGIIPQKSINAIFGNIEVIHKLSGEFVTRLERTLTGTSTPDAWIWQ
eukprot:PhF_6_TR44297/c0_g1_i2/m.68311